MSRLAVTELEALHARLRAHVPAFAPGLIAVGLMLVWAVHDGGYDADTWYWGALATLATLAAVLIALGAERLRRSRLTIAAATLFALYVAFSYLSISWAQSPGDALQGSNRALLYLLVFLLFASLPWTAEGALATLTVFAIGVGTIAIVLLFRLASADHVQRLVVEGRLLAPTGYFNSSVALFTIGTLLSIALATRRELPGLLRGLLIALACACLQLALIGESRGWLFTLPLVALATIALVTDRLRFVAISLLPIVAVLIPLHRLLAVYKSTGAASLNHAASRAGQLSLALCAAVFILATLIAWAETVARPRALSPLRRRQVGALVAALALAASCGGALVATHGHPFSFVKRQWHGFVHPAGQGTTSSYFGVVGSSRYDFWRVSLDAVVAHPLGGLGQDNFSDYYITRRRTSEEPQWTHSLELRLLVHTGAIGFLLFGGFLATAIALAVRRRRLGATPRARAAAGTALLALVVWLIHGSVDWFWEVPALSGPALGFLAMAGALTADTPATVPAGAAQGRQGVQWRLRSREALQRVPGAAWIAAAGVALLAAVLVLALPYLSVREVSLATDVRATDSSAALRDLSRAANLNPLSPVPGRLGGAIALQVGDYRTAEARFRQAIGREPGAWFGWLGDGLAASQLGDRVRARHDFEVAYSINRVQPAVGQALARVGSKHPLTPAEAFQMFVIAQ